MSKSMNGYWRMSSDTTHKARSVDDFTSSFPETPKAAITPTKAEGDDEDGGGKGERFGVILGRSASVSSCCSSGSGGFQVTMKRAFSMRRSSSVSERYSRIHDQYTAITSPIEDDEMGGATRSEKKQRGVKIKILKACKRLLRFSS